jgi:hypothetical protein
VLLVIEYLVVPELAGASKDLYLLGRVNAAWSRGAGQKAMGTALATMMARDAPQPENQQPELRHPHIPEPS